MKNLNGTLLIFDFKAYKGRMIAMIKKVAKVKNINDKNLILDDLNYWLNKSHEERVAAVDYLRRQFHGSSERLQRVARVIQRSQS
jgi:hypothetical protein